ncbi:putative membrane protein [Alkalihalobacillus xiaoxiensis]|uniref:Membrane protein n=1 Tax=Shouchella xiaoxiensis TaxID=766895 RepID=A0ABS2SQA4_9BACI|nr:YibE/F family protein [Shouchella xiaoxiensis]MBM7837191.1 putative membrane protein [Shouchella xiaoxiensis]
MGIGLFLQKRALFISVLVVLCLASLLFVWNNHSFYERSIAKVVETELISEEEVVDTFQNEDVLYEQRLLGEILNGDYEGRQIELTNSFSASGGFDLEFREGNELFVSVYADSVEEDVLNGTINDVKRDHYLVAVGWLFLFVLVAVGNRQGLYSALSLGVNGLILFFALDVYMQTSNSWLLPIAGVSAVLFTIVTLLLVNGANRKTYTAILVTLIVTAITMLLAFLVIRAFDGEGLRFEEMQFLTRPYELVFLAGLLIGSLGAVMDVAITMSASVFGMFEEDKKIDMKTLKQSGLEIGRDVMGTMTNIMFFAYVSGSIPALLLYFRNHSPLDFMLSMNLSLEIARALVGGIGIVLAIPIGLYVSLFFVKRKKVTE